MMKNVPRATWLTLLRRTLLTLAVLTSAAAAVVVGYAAAVFVSGYDGGNDPESLTAIAFPIAMLIFGIAGVPLIFASAASWVGYSAVARKSRQFPR
jgi:drug/metabolite transporter (DMT)-like permease